MQKILATVLCVLIAFALAKPLTVHVVPHSHDDAGWLMTMDEYFTQQVKSILDTVTDTLFKNPTLTFHQVEQIYFQKWWKQASATQQQQFRTIYTRGQVEFLNGGWVMHDDACPTYSAMIDQTTMGHQFINDLFGADALPITGWTVDPFGLSPITAKINKACNQDYHVISRISFEVKDKLKADHSLDFLWKFDPTSDKKIFTHVWWDLYCTPGPLYWDQGGTPVTEKTVKAFADLFAQFTKLWKTGYKAAEAGDNLLFPFGCDFQFQHAPRMYGNMSLVIDYINKNVATYNMQVKYSKVSEYMKAVAGSTQNATYDYKQVDGDFFPYADNINSFWTGYFVSRAEVKNRARQSERYTRTADILFALARGYGKNITYNDNYEKLFSAKYSNGLVQHHDGITGTEKVPVVANYLQYLNQGVTSANQVTSKALLQLIAKSSATIGKLEIVDASQSDVATRKLNNGDVVPVVVYNSLGWDRASTIRIRMNKANVKVTHFDGSVVPSQIYDYGSEDFELVFATAASVPALGYTTFLIHVSAQESNTAVIAKPVQDSIISNEIYDLTYANGQLEKIKNKRDNVEISVTRQYAMYDSYTGPGQASGAYIFRSTGPSAEVISQTAQTVHSQGDVEHSITQEYGPIKENVRLYKLSDKDSVSPYGDASVIEYNLQVGTLPGNKEAIIRFNTNIKSNGQLLTENNGFSSLVRKYRNWPNDASKSLYPTASNFYPLVYHATIGDETVQLTVVVNSTRGVASLSDGSIEIMVHRRCLVDDGRGVSDPMDDVEQVPIQVRIIVEKVQKQGSVRAQLAHRANYPLSGFVFQDLQQSMVKNYGNLFNTDFAPLSAPLAENVHLLNFGQQNVNGKEVTLVRAANLEQFEQKTSTVDFGTLFKDLRAGNYTETSMNGIVPIKNPDFVAKLENLDIKTFTAVIRRK